MAEPPKCLALLGEGDVGVGVGGEAERAVAEDLHDDPQVDSVGPEEGGGGVAQVVEPHVPHPARFSKAVKARLRLRGSNGVPMVVVKTRPVSCHPGAGD